MGSTLNRNCQKQQLLLHERKKAELEELHPPEFFHTPYILHFVSEDDVSTKITVMIFNILYFILVKSSVVDLIFKVGKLGKGCCGAQCKYFECYLFILLFDTFLIR